MPAACYVPSTAPRLISCRIRKLTLSPSDYTRSPTHLQTLPSDTSALSSTPPKLCFLAPNCAESTILGCRGGKKASRVKGASSGIVCSVHQVSFHRFCLG